MKGLLIGLSLLMGGQVYATDVDDHKSVAREFFQGQRHIVEAVRMLAGQEVEEATDIAEDLKGSVESSCELRENKTINSVQLLIEGENCIMPTRSTSKYRYGNGFRAEDTRWLLDLTDEFFSSITGRTSFDGRYQSSMQEYFNGSFEGEVTESTRTELLNDIMGHFHARVYMRGYRDFNGDYLLTMWQLRSQLKVGDSIINMNANFDRYGRHCVMNNESMNCDELLDILGGKEN